MAQSAAVKKLLKELSGKKIAAYGRDFLQTWDKTRDELEATLLVAEILMRLRHESRDTRLWKTGLAVSWFRDKSTRTRFSFKSAANLLGLSVQDLDESKSQIAHGETVRETVNMMSFLTEVVGIRDDMFIGEGHTFMQEVARSLDFGYTRNILPQRPSVINLQCDRDHPTQSLADLLHLKTYFGSLSALKGKQLVMSWAYSPSYGKPLSVAQGIAALMTRFGVNVTLAYPQGYSLIPDIEEMIAKGAKKSGSRFRIVHDMKAAFRGADIVYPKSWAPYRVMQKRTALLHTGDKKGLEDLEKDALATNAKHEDWECTEEMMRLTRGGKALYMHCLPADVSGLSCKEGEVAKSVFERYIRETFREAGYKPYIIAAMMVLTQFSDPVKILRRVAQKNAHRKSA